MKTLIVEDDFTSRLLLQELLRPLGAAHVAVNGREAVAAVGAALAADEPYELICLDIMMPEMDGQAALKELRAIEHAHGRLGSKGARVIMTTALRDPANVMEAFREQCDGYLVKPIDRAKLFGYLSQFKFVA